MKYIIVAPTSNINLKSGTTAIRILGQTPNLDWVDPTDNNFKKQWLTFSSRRGAENMIKKMKSNPLYNDMYLISYGVNE